jgi:hypothetical protein
VPVILNYNTNIKAGQAGGMVEEEVVSSIAGISSGIAEFAIILWLLIVGVRGQKDVAGEAAPRTTGVSSA